MARSDIRPIYSRNCYRFKNSFSFGARSNDTSNFSNASRFTDINGSGNLETLSERGNLRSPLHGAGLLQSHISCPEEGRRHETCHRPQLPKPVHRNSSFSNGTSLLPKNPATKGLLHDKIGPERCISVSTNSLRVTKVSSLLLEKRNIPVQGPPIRPEHSSNDLHTFNETGCRFPQKTGCPLDHLSRRYTDNRTISAGGDPLNNHGHGPPGVSRFHTEPGEIHSDSDSNDSVLRFFDRFDHNEGLLTVRKDNQTTQTVSSARVHHETQAKEHRPTPGAIRILPPGNLEGTSALPLPSSATYSWSSELQPQLRGGGLSL